ncbi:MAG: hypothetical protein C5B51_32180 [Terriglobia bacterium]|nr:MAG: hypothetical protein C5B51_32180 [Terriglobia bacterium]
MDNEAQARIRQAISQEQYQEGLALWTVYVQRLEQQIEQGSISPDEMRAAGELVEWSRLVLRSAQARLVQRRNTLLSAAAYLGRIDSSRHRVHIAG